MDTKSNKNLGQLRREYKLDQLEESQLTDDPMVLFAAWMEQAQNSGNPDPTAMTLSTIERNAYPSSRIVLLKQIDKGRLVFFTNYHSRKAREIGNSPGVAAHFYWPELERQLRIAEIGAHRFGLGRAGLVNAVGPLRDPAKRYLQRATGGKPLRKFVFTDEPKLHQPPHRRPDIGPVLKARLGVRTAGSARSSADAVQSTRAPSLLPHTACR